MLDMTDNGNLMAYHRKIKKLAKKYSSCWPLIYQADVRMRSERACRIRDLLEARATRYENNGWTLETPFDKERPWSAVWAEMAIFEDKFWREQVGDPSHMM